MDSSAIIFESSEVQILAAWGELHGVSVACDSHVHRFVSHLELQQSARALLDRSVMEGLWLVELLSVLSSVLISVEILLRGPTCRVPECWIHHVSRAVVDEGLSLSVEVGLVCDQGLAFQSSLLWELFERVSGSKDLLGEYVWIHEACSKGCFVAFVFGMVSGMSWNLSLSAVSSRSGMHRFVCFRDVKLIETRRCHFAFNFIEHFLGEYVSALLCNSLLQQAVSGQSRHVALVLRDHAVLAFNWMPLETIKQRLWQKSFAYHFGHVVITGPVHVARGPLEEDIFVDGTWLPGSSEVKFIFALTSEGVIKWGPGYTHVAKLKLKIKLIIIIF